MKTPSPRPWMPLLRRRFALSITSVPRTAPLVVRDDEGRLRVAPPVRRGLFRRGASDLRRRIDQLAAEREAWIAERSGDC